MGTLFPSSPDTQPLPSTTMNSCGPVAGWRGMNPPAPTWKHAKRDPTSVMNIGLITVFDAFGSTR
jgi:hypothetical protein